MRPMSVLINVATALLLLVVLAVPIMPAKLVALVALIVVRYFSVKRTRAIKSEGDMIILSEEDVWRESSDAARAESIKDTDRTGDDSPIPLLKDGDRFKMPDE